MEVSKTYDAEYKVSRKCQPHFPVVNIVLTDEDTATQCLKNI